MARRWGWVGRAAGAAAAAAAVALAAAVAAPSAVAAAEVPLGALSTLAHDVAGEVVAINERTLEVRNFRYDGAGPAAYWWVGTGPVSGGGVAAKEVPGCAGPAGIPAADGTVTVRVELPADMDVTAIDYLSVWCEDVDVDFGSVGWGDRHGAVDGAVAPAPAGGYTCYPTGGGGAPPLPNCVALNERLQVRWGVVNGSTVQFSLTARMAPTEWAGFGVSGSATGTQMVGSDVTIVSVNSSGVAVAHDFHMSARSPCSAGGAGVCPDTVALGGGGTDDVSGLVGSRDGDVATVRFSRPVQPTDLAAPARDRPLFVSPGGVNYISWALGPLDATSGLPRIHVSPDDYPSGGRDVSLVLGREPADDCGGPLLPAIGGGGGAITTAWARPPVVGETTFDVVIGPSGGPHGYRAIHANHTGWGIAYYINDLLVPVLVVERGKTYTFSTRTGDDLTNAARYHPLYITDSDKGGYFLLTPEAQAAERVYAGLGRAANGSVVPAVVSPLCEYEEGENPDRETDFATYAAGLTLDCGAAAPADVPPGQLTWTVAPDTPDVVYYQCTEHADLGFRIAVFDAGAADPAVYNSLVADSPLFAAAAAPGGNSSGSDCELAFGGDTRAYSGCVMLSDRIELYWTLDEEAQTADMALRTVEPAGYAAIGWPNTPALMVPGDAVVAAAAGNAATVAAYHLTARSSAGVQPAADRLDLTAAAAEVRADGTLAAVWTRPYAPASGSPPLSRGAVDFMWALGAAPAAAGALAQHTFRASGSVDLAAASGSVTAQVAGLGAFYTAHALLMAVPWLVLIPAAIIFARYFRGAPGSSGAWFQAHRAVNTVSVVAILVGWGMGLARGSRSETAHLILGCIVVPLAVLQVVAGVLRPSKEAGTARKLWYAAHSWAGRTAVVAAAVNVFLGLRIRRVDASTGWYVGVGVYVGVLAVAVVGLEVWRWMSRRRAD